MLLSTTLIVRGTHFRFLIVILMKYGALSYVLLTMTMLITKDRLSCEFKIMLMHITVMIDVMSNLLCVSYVCTAVNSIKATARVPPRHQHIYINIYMYIYIYPLWWRMWQRGTTTNVRLIHVTCFCKWNGVGQTFVSWGNFKLFDSV